MRLLLHGRHGVVMDSVEKVEQLMILGVAVHILPGLEGKREAGSMTGGGHWADATARPLPIT